MPAENSVDQAVRLADKKVESVAGHLATFCEMLQSVVCSQDLSEQIVGLPSASEKQHAVQASGDRLNVTGSHCFAQTNGIPYIQENNLKGKGKRPLLCAGQANKHKGKRVFLPR
jgi:hypothetical protein